MCRIVYGKCVWIQKSTFSPTFSRAFCLRRVNNHSFQVYCGSCHCTHNRIDKNIISHEICRRVCCVLFRHGYITFLSVCSCDPYIISRSASQIHIQLFCLPCCTQRLGTYIALYGEPHLYHIWDISPTYLFDTFLWDHQVHTGMFHIFRYW